MNEINEDGQQYGEIVPISKEKCEPLRGAKLEFNHPSLFPVTIKGFSYKRVKSAVDFYKKYKDRYDILRVEKPKVYAKLVTANKNLSPFESIPYNDWLLNYSFGDVVDE